MRFADGQWSGCNLFFLKTPRARAAIDSWQAVEADAWTTLSWSEDTGLRRRLRRGTREIVEEVDP